jgi:hypothetical protein
MLRRRTVDGGRVPNVSTTVNPADAYTVLCPTSRRHRQIARTHHRIQFVDAAQNALTVGDEFGKPPRRVTRSNDTVRKSTEPIFTLICHSGLVVHLPQNAARLRKLICRTRDGGDRSLDQPHRSFALVCVVTARPDRCSCCSPLLVVIVVSVEDALLDLRRRRQPLDSSVVIDDADLRLVVGDQCAL